MFKFLLNPKNWPVFIGIGIARLIALLPYSFLMWLGRGLGYIAYYIARERKQVIETNIKLCFPELSPQEQISLIKENMISTTLALFETILMLFASDKKLRKLIEVEGVEHVEKALAEKQGVILLCSHFTMLDLATRMINMCLPVRTDGMYRKQKNPLFEHVVYHARKKFCGELIEKKELLKMIKRLKSNHIIWYAPDQNFNYQHVFVPFFGIQAATVTGTSKIARHTGAKVVPMVYYRKPNNAGYHFKIYPALENFPSDNDQEDAARIMQITENSARQHPDQYLWAHRRFRTRPPGEPLIYPKKKKRK